MHKNRSIAVDFTGFVVDPSSLGKGDIGPKETGQLCAEMLQHKYCELFAALDLDELARALFAWVRLYAITGAELSLDDQLAWGETGLFELLQRGAIKLVIQTPEANADLQKLQAAVTKANLRPQTQPAAEPAPVAEPPALDPTDECVNDFKTLPSGDFRLKWLKPSTRHIYEAAVAGGRI
jgi:hypothetical protein